MLTCNMSVSCEQPCKTGCECACPSTDYYAGNTPQAGTSDAPTCPNNDCLNPNDKSSADTGRGSAAGSSGGAGSGMGGGAKPAASSSTQCATKAQANAFSRFGSALANAFRSVESNSKVTTSQNKNAVPIFGATSTTSIIVLVLIAAVLFVALSGKVKV